MYFPFADRTASVRAFLAAAANWGARALVAAFFASRSATVFTTLTILLFAAFTGASHTALVTSAFTFFSRAARALLQYASLAASIAIILLFESISHCFLYFANSAVNTVRAASYPTGGATTCGIAITALNAAEVAAGTAAASPAWAAAPCHLPWAMGRTFLKRPNASLEQVLGRFLRLLMLPHTAAALCCTMPSVIFWALITAWFALASAVLFPNFFAVYAAFSLSFATIFGCSAASTVMVVWAVAALIRLSSYLMSHTDGKIRPFRYGLASTGRLNPSR
mmetsp:Transcript_25077/g.60811  ORF Transcript_25077/g.60811 Transcript_25077/m.60811 type:complete len:280 (+) Transcript_25077:95-934(+)